MRPTLRCLIVFVAGIPLALTSVAISPRLWTLWLAYLGAAVLLAGLDAVLALPSRRLAIAPTLPDQLFIGETGTAKLAITARWPLPARLEVVAELDPDLAPQPPIAITTAPPPAHTTAELQLVPRRRGEHALRAIHARWSGPLGLIERRVERPCGDKVGVVPNTGAVRAIALRMFADRNFLAGLKVERYLGDGTEFESLREYLPGLDHRAIDWKASARHRKLLCQEFRAERNHQVVLAVDAGQLMSEPVAGVPKLDHAINAAILLGWFCLRTGDRVGLLGFDAKVQSWIEPAGGLHAFARLQAMTAELDYKRVETNYTLTLAELSTRLRRRSLVVLFTDFLDTVTAELMIDNVTRLARRHLVLFVAINDPSLETRALARPRSLDVLHQAVVASDFARERSVVLERLRRAGAHCIDATPGQLTMTTVNRYLDIKRRELF
ncbi:MAG TPA: DUF58 domain-containing protein [Kofleriaceae bacterium]|nr:DUF58 domain-containing protein [Kofleriaceae bacterium]